MLPRRWIGVAVLLIGGNLFAENIPLSPPQNCATEKIGGTEYLKGEVYLSSHQDTVALARFGFKRLEFVGRSLRSVKYSAIWPATVPLDSLSVFVSGLDYELVEGESPEPTNAVLLNPGPELQAVLERAAAKVDTASLALPYRRVVIGDLGDGGVVYYYRPTASAAPTPPSADTRDVRQSMSGNFQVTPVNEWPFRTKESLFVDDDPNVGFIHVLPVNEGRYHTAESVVVPDDPNLGTFHVLPVNQGRYHTTEKVTTRDNPAVGNFQVRPPFVRGLLTRPRDFEIKGNYSTFRTGQTFFVTPDANNRPRTMSMQEWQRLHTK